MALGKYLLGGAALLTLAAVVLGVLRRREAARRLFAGATALTGLAGLLLLQALLASNFALDYVVRYTSRDLGVAYKIAAFWAGQEGTVLLWTLLLQAVALTLWRQRPGAAVVVAGQVALFCGLLLARSPFAEVAGPVPADGHGLNPLLLNPWMIVHPPVLFIGYALLAAPFGLALASVWRGDGDGWLAPAHRWLLWGWVMLGAGMMLGGYWAYITLGWGGFWAWDPVENSSLIPWLGATALLHGCLVQRRAGGLRRLNYGLVVFSFVATLYGSYLTRSGILGDFSVHSFESLGAGYNLLWVAVVLLPLLLGLVVLGRGWRALAGAEPPSNLIWLVQATWVLIAMTGLLLLGTSYPLLSQLVGPGQAVEQSFHNRTQSLCFIAGAGLMLLLIAPKATGVRLAVTAAAVLGALAVVATLAPTYRGETRGALIVLGAACGTMLALSLRRVNHGRRFGLPGELGAGLAHGGMALLVLGAVISGPGQRLDSLELTLGESATGRETGVAVTFHEIRERPDGKIALTLSADGATPVETLVYQTQNGIMRHPALFSHASGDIYVEPIEIVPGGHAHGGPQAKLAKGESAELAGLTVTFVKFDLGQHGMSDRMVVGSVLKVSDGTGQATVTAEFQVTDSGVETPSVEALGRSLRVAQILPDEGAVVVEVETDGAEPAGALLRLTVTRKPFIWLVWLGTVTLLGGGLIALRGRQSKPGEETGRVEFGGR